MESSPRKYYLPHISPRNQYGRENLEAIPRAVKVNHLPNFFKCDTIAAISSSDILAIIFATFSQVVSACSCVNLSQVSRRNPLYIRKEMRTCLLPLLIRHNPYFLAIALKFFRHS